VKVLPERSCAGSWVLPPPAQRPHSASSWPGSVQSLPRLQIDIKIELKKHHFAADLNSTTELFVDITT
jgi:hypothetical protein